MDLPLTYARRILNLTDVVQAHKILKEFSISLLNELRDLPQRVVDPNWRGKPEEDDGTKASSKSPYRCEAQGLGVAAFAYYRRVVENRKNEIFDAICEVATKLNAPAEFLSSLEDAKKDHRFTNSVERIKPGLPQMLLLDGENPLTLLLWKDLFLQYHCRHCMKTAKKGLCDCRSLFVGRRGTAS